MASFVSLFCFYCTIRWDRRYSMYVMKEIYILKIFVVIINWPTGLLCKRRWFGSTSCKLVYYFLGEILIISFINLLTVTICIVRQSFSSSLTSSGLKPVSYTHLDVYKRQLQESFLNWLCELIGHVSRFSQWPSLTTGKSRLFIISLRL